MVAACSFGLPQGVHFFFQQSVLWTVVALITAARELRDVALSPPYETKFTSCPHPLPHSASWCVITTSCPCVGERGTSGPHRLGCEIAWVGIMLNV